MQKNLCIYLISVILLFALYPMTGAEERSSSEALLLIDIQDFYFPGGRTPLVGPVSASLKAKQILNFFREMDLPVVHIRHVSQSGSGIHENVKPQESEKVISKKDVNSFKNTDLLAYLKANNIRKLVICGLMTHMCVEAAVRAAHDFGFEVILVHDACATRSIMFGNVEISAEAVHHSTLASLSGYYARVVDTETFLREFF